MGREHLHLKESGSICFKTDHFVETQERHQKYTKDHIENYEEIRH